ncbi:expressed protein [Phakopsora pachyrhizi]|uniref:Expressed protein n=1 Tax=Phakopsora pachyrhizi TaxID=170000 RepID=A0AAV0BBK4_PHAPC|nr:expressed protein [Phakopsora pachyrhizi]
MESSSGGSTPLSHVQFLLPSSTLNLELDPKDSFVDLIPTLNDTLNGYHSFSQVLKERESGSTFKKSTEFYHDPPHFDKDMDNVFSKNLSKPSLENPKDAISRVPYFEENCSKDKHQFADFQGCKSYSSFVKSRIFSSIDISAVTNFSIRDYMLNSQGLKAQNFFKEKCEFLDVEMQEPNKSIGEEHINFNSPQDLYGIPLLNDKLPDNYSSSFIQNFNNSTISKIGYEIQPFDPISAIHDFESADIVEKQTRLSFIGGKTPTDFNKNFGENQSKYYEKEMFQNVVSTVDDGNKESWFGVGLNFVSPPIIDNAEIQKYPELDERAKYFEKEFTFGPIFDCSAFSSQYFGFPDQKSLNDFLILSDNLVSTLDISPKFAPETANGVSAHICNECDLAPDHISSFSLSKISEEESINRLASLGRMAFELNTLKGIGKNWEAKANEINYEQSAIPADSIRDRGTPMNNNLKSSDSSLPSTLETTDETIKQSSNSSFFPHKQLINDTVAFSNDDNTQFSEKKLHAQLCSNNSELCFSLYSAQKSSDNLRRKRSLTAQKSQASKGNSHFRSNSIDTHDSYTEADTIERRTEKSKITTDGEIESGVIKLIGSEVCAEAKHTGIMNPPKKADAAKTSNESINSPESTSFCKSYGRKRAVQVKGTEREKEDPKQEEIPIVNLRKDLVNQVLVLSKSNLNFSKEPSLEALSPKLVSASQDSLKVGPQASISNTSSQDIKEAHLFDKHSKNIELLKIWSSEKSPSCNHKNNSSESALEDKNDEHKQPKKPKQNKVFSASKTGQYEVQQPS